MLYVVLACLVRSAAKNNKEMRNRKILFAFLSSDLFKVLKEVEIISYSVSKWNIY